MLELGALDQEIAFKELKAKYWWKLRQNGIWVRNRLTWILIHWYPQLSLLSYQM